MIQLRAKGIEDDKLYKGIHQAIISEETFNNVQAILSGRMERVILPKYTVQPKIAFTWILKMPGLR